PGGCAANVRGQVDAVGRVLAQAGGAHARLGDVLVIGSSTGYGLSSLATAIYGYGARAVGVCLERPPQGDKTASAGWYNLAALGAAARADGRSLTVINGDAFGDEVKADTLAKLKAAGAKLDTVVYSLAAPKRQDPRTGTAWSSVLKPIGASYRSKSISLGNDQITEVEIGPAND